MQVWSLNMQSIIGHQQHYNPSSSGYHLVTNTLPMSYVISNCATISSQPSSDIMLMSSGSSSTTFNNTNNTNNSNNNQQKMDMNQSLDLQSMRIELEQTKNKLHSKTYECNKLRQQLKQYSTELEQYKQILSSFTQNHGTSANNNNLNPNELLSGKFEN